MEPESKKRRGPYGKKEMKKNPSSDATAVASTSTEISDTTIMCQLTAEPAAETVSYETGLAASGSTENKVSHSSAAKKTQSKDQKKDAYHETAIDDTPLLALDDSTYTPVNNDVFDQQFDELVSGIQADAKERNYDQLADDEDLSNVLQNETEVLDHLTEILQTSTTTEGCNNDDAPDAESDPGSKKLFEGSCYSLGAAVLLICCFIIRFRLPDEAVSYFLQILACLLPQGHKLMSTLYHLRKFLKEFTADMLPTVHYHCNHCYTNVDKNAVECPACFKTFNQPGSMAYFVQLKIISQLRALWKNPDFYSAVTTYRFKHYKNNTRNSIKDIYDGEIYKKLYNEGILNNRHSLSFSLNTDGVPLFKSSNVGMWPVYLLINELPIAERKKRQNALFYGVWVSSRKPQMWSFLKPLFDELQILETKGESFTNSHGESFISKCVLLTCTCDLPARALVYNFNQYNGAHSCWFCLEKGETYRLETGGICHIYPYKAENPKGTPRTKESVLQDVETVKQNIALQKKSYVVNGHKGPFWFMYLKHFDIINSCVIDYMHGVCLGIMKLLLGLWFDKSNKDKAFSYFEARKNVNDALQYVKPTVYVTRIPRSLDDLVHWKSSEFRNFILYWGVPILKGILNAEHFAHFCVLTKGYFLLCKEEISTQDLQTAEACILLFVENFVHLYGLRYYTLNLHQLVHLTDCVKQTGPLFVNNCFIFEDLNGYIVKHVHGTQGVEAQLVNIISMLKVTPLMFNYYLGDSSSDAKEIYYGLHDSVYNRRAFEDELEDGIRPVGSVRWRTLSEEEFCAVAQLGAQTRVLKCFDKINMFKLGFYVYGNEYRRLQKRRQDVVTYSENNEFHFASVICFIQLDLQDSTTANVALIQRFQKVEPFGSVWRITAEAESPIATIPINSIVNVNNFVIFRGTKYVCPAPNRYDRD